MIIKYEKSDSHFIVRNNSCGKVMFSQASVCPQGEVYIPWADTLQADTPWADIALGRHPPGQTPPPQTATAFLSWKKSLEKFEDKETAKLKWRNVHFCINY